MLHFGKKVSTNPEKFGKGAIEGVASPEACNNAAMGGTFIPLFSLGIPSNAITAVLLGALMIYGLTPGIVGTGSVGHFNGEVFSRSNSIKIKD